MALSEETGVRDSISALLRTQGLLTEESEKIIAAAFDRDPRSHYMNHTEMPSGPTVLCIMALVEHIERLEDRIGRMGMGLPKLQKKKGLI